MKPIGRALLELRSVLFSIGLAASLLDSMIVLLFGVLVALLLSLPWWLALVPFGLYFVWHSRALLRALGYADVERRVPQLREALRTAADSLSQENEVVRGLHQEVLEKMRLVQTSAFIGFGKMTRQLVVAALLCFMIISVSALNIHLVDANALLTKAGVLADGGWKDVGELFGKIGKETQNAKMLEKEVTLLDESSLYGNKSVIELGSEELELQLSAEMSGIKIGDVRDAESKKFNDVRPNDIQASTDSAFTEDIPKEYQGIVRNYFQNIPN